MPRYRVRFYFERYDEIVLNAPSAEDASEQATAAFTIGLEIPQEGIVVTEQEAFVDMTETEVREVNEDGIPLEDL